MGKGEKMEILERFCWLVANVEVLGAYVPGHLFRYSLAVRQASPRWEGGLVSGVMGRWGSYLKVHAIKMNG